MRRLWRGQRDRRGRSLEFMMRLESRLRLSEERRGVYGQTDVRLQELHAFTPAPH